MESDRARIRVILSSRAAQGSPFYQTIADLVELAAVKDFSVVPERFKNQIIWKDSVRLETIPMSTTNQETILQWAFEHSSNGKLITDLEGVITSINNAFVEMFGYTREEVIGKRTSLLRSRSSTQEFYQEMWKSLNRTGEWKGEIVNRMKSGEEKPCFLTITSIITPSGEKLGYFGVEIDLSDRKRMEAQVIQGEKLASIGESLATLMHEIRNPINGISMNIYMLEAAAKENSEWSEEERESIHLIGKEVKRLESLIKNALSYARKVDIHFERVLLSDFLRDINELLVHQAKEKGVILLINMQTGELSGYFDPDLMKQVMLNLVMNAIEAAVKSRTPKVRLTAYIEEAPQWRYLSASAKVLVFQVENSGERISEEIAKNLFKPFFTTKEQGLGIGLATSAKIVRQHHGIVTHAHSDALPFTTVFTVALPI
jgi:PAS domain S-box-containing protein